LILDGLPIKKPFYQSLLLAPHPLHTDCIERDTTPENQRNLSQPAKNRSRTQK